MATSDIAARRKPNLLERGIAMVAPKVALERAYARERFHHFAYDSADNDGRRGDSGGATKNAHRENPKAQRDRVKIMWDARDLVRNMPVLSLAKKRLCSHAFGKCRYQAQVGSPDGQQDDDLNSRIESAFEWWSENRADIAGQWDFRTLLELSMGDAITDGDYGVIPTAMDDEGNMIEFDKNTGRPLNGFPAWHAFRGITADRIGNPTSPDAGTDESFTAGVKLDPKTGRRMFYHVYRCTKMANYVKEAEIPAGQFLHLFRPEWSNQVRGYTFFAPVLPMARDLYEMFHMESQAAKWTASFAGVIRDAGAGGRAGPSGGVDFDGNKKADGTPTQKAQAGTLLRLGPGEDITPFDTGNRPSGAFTAYIQAALDQIAMGLDLPFGFFDLTRFGGVTARLETAQVQRIIDLWRGLVILKVGNPMKNLAISDLVLNRRIERPRAGMTKGRWNFGAAMTADIGYQTQADINRLMQGLTTRTKLCGEQGEDFEDVATTLIEEAAVIVRKANAAGLPPEVISALLAPWSQKQMAAAQMQAQGVQADAGNAVGNIVSALVAVSRGEMPREQAIETLSAAGVPPDQAALILKINKAA